MELILDPPVGVGPLSLGMSLAEAQAILRSMPGYVDSASSPLFAHFASELSISMEVDSEDLVKSIEVGRPSVDADVTVLFRGIRIFESPADEVIAELQSTQSLDLEEGGRRAVAPDLLLALWRPTLPDGPGDDDGRFFESALVARPGYYETYR